MMLDTGGLEELFGKIIIHEDGKAERPIFVNLKYLRLPAVRLHVVYLSLTFSTDTLFSFIHHLFDFYLIAGIELLKNTVCRQTLRGRNRVKSPVK